MCQIVNVLEKYQFQMLVVFLPMFAADTKIIRSYNFVAPLKASMVNVVNWAELTL